MSTKRRERAAMIMRPAWTGIRITISAFADGLFIQFLLILAAPALLLRSAIDASNISIYAWTALAALVLALRAASRAHHCTEIAIKARTQQLLDSKEFRRGTYARRVVGILVVSLSAIVVPIAYWFIRTHGFPEDETYIAAFLIIIAGSLVIAEINTQQTNRQG